MALGWAKIDSTPSQSHRPVVGRKLPSALTLVKMNRPLSRVQTRSGAPNAHFPGTTTFLTNGNDHEWPLVAVIDFRQACAPFSLGLGIGAQPRSQLLRELDSPEQVEPEQNERSAEDGIKPPAHAAAIEGLQEPASGRTHEHQR